MHTISNTPGALRLFGGSIIARLPMVMLSIGLIVHARHLTGSFAAAGILAAALAVAEGLGGPLLGRLVDRCGQTVVLLAGAAVSGSALAAVALLPPACRSGCSSSSRSSSAPRCRRWPRACVRSCPSWCPATRPCAARMPPRRPRTS